jgi:cell division transport system permease protein
VYLCTHLSQTPGCSATEASADQIAAVKQKLESPELKGYIKSMDFENHQQAYDKFKDQFADSSVSSLVTPDLLPQTFWINLKDPDRSSVISESLANQPGVDEVVDQRAYLQPIFDALNAASYTAIGIAVLMLVAAVLLIATTIRLSAFSRRRELGIMRLVGASNRFIETPFVLEGVIASLIGSVLAGAAVWLLVKFFVRGYLADSVPLGTSLIGTKDALIVIPILIVMGAALAAISASFAIRRYLKV